MTCHSIWNNTAWETKVHIQYYEEKTYKYEANNAYKDWDRLQL